MRVRSRSITATTFAHSRCRPELRMRSRSRDSFPSTFGRCFARGRAHFAGRRYRGIRRTFTRPIRRSSICFRRMLRCAGGSSWPANGWPGKGSRLKFAGSAYGERHLAGLRFNDMVARGILKAPIAIGRDHLDCGSVASPNRETEAMKDGSDAIADWPILNALINTAAGASWVSVHHGGGVGMGYSIHAGMVVVADGSDEAARRLERVLLTDPGMGIVRHVDAGYEERRWDLRVEYGVRIPAIEVGEVPDSWED